MGWPLREHGVQAVGDAFAEIVEALERRRAAPRHEHGDRAFAVAEIEPLERRLDRSGNGGGIDVVAERQLRRDHRHVAQRQRFERRDEDRRAGHLHGVLRGADHGGADARVGPRQLQPARREPRAQFGGKLRPDIAERLGLAAVNVFRHAAGKADVGNRRRDSERIEPQQIGAAGARRAAAHGFEQFIGHARGERARLVFGQDRAGLEFQAEFGAEAAAGLFEPRRCGVPRRARRAARRHRAR